VPTPFCEPAQKEFLGEGGTDALCSPDRKIPEDQADTAICSRVVQVGDCRCRQNSAQGRVVRPQIPIVVPAVKRAQNGVSESRSGCASSLIKIARIVVQQRWQDGATDHDVDKAIGSSYADALAIGVPALSKLGTVARLLGSSDQKNSSRGNRVAGDL